MVNETLIARRGQDGHGRPAARQATHQAFERAHFEGADHGATTQDFLAAIDATTPTLTDQMVDGFRNDAAKFTRY